MLLPVLLIYLVIEVFSVTTEVKDSLELTGRGSTNFGSCVRMNDNVFVVASPLDDKSGRNDGGSVTIFSRRDGSVSEKITRNESTEAYNGYSLALSESFLLVSSLHDDGRQATGNEGAVYVHKYNGSSWLSSVQKIFANDGTTNAQFGSSIAIHGNTLVVGARYDNTKGNKSGAAYIFTYNGVVWMQTQKLEPSDLATNEMIGSCIAISNKYIAVGGQRFVYIFTINYKGIWREQTKLNPPNFGASSLGNNIDIYESRIVIGADNKGRSEGNAYVYIRDAGAWVLEATLKASDGTAGNYFGFSVSIDKQTVLIGAQNSTNKDVPNSGGAYAFELIDKNWTEVAKFVSHRSNTGGYFGVSVDVLNGIAFVGRSESDDTAAAYVFTALQNFVVECTEKYVRGIWRRGQFSGEIKVGPNDPPCNQLRGGNLTHVWVKSLLADCGFMTQHEKSIIHISTTKLTVTSSKSNAIQWGTDYKFTMHCEFAGSKNTVIRQMYDIKLPEPAFPPIVNKTEVPDFTAAIALYTNEYFVEEAFSPVTIGMHERIYIGITQLIGNLKYKFTVHECTATPRDVSSPSLLLFYQGCPLDSTMMKVFTSNENHFQFQIDASRFISLSHQVYIHCLAYVCMASSTAAGCVQTCANTTTRKRRSNEAPLKEISVTTPLVTFIKKVTCAEINSTCPRHSTCLELFPATCRCNERYVKNMKSDLCDSGMVEVDGTMEDRRTTIKDISIDKPFIAAYLDTSSAEFQKLARDAEQQISYYIQLYNDPSIVGIKVISARNGSVLLDILIIRNANVTEKQAFNVFVGAIIVNRTELMNSSETSNITRPDFLGVSIKIMDGRMPRLPTDEVPDEAEEDIDRTTLIAVLVPALVVIIACFIVFVVIVQRRTQTHYLFE